MVWKKQNAASRPAVARVAGWIRDPVVRLRFLQSVERQDVVERRPWQKPVYALLCFLLLLAIAIRLFLVHAGVPEAGTRVSRAPTGQALPAPRVPGERVADIWLVERAGEAEIYSNGLRVDTRFQVSNHPRFFLAFPAGRGLPGAAERRNRPVGIILHTTESLQAPFEEQENRTLQRIGESLLDYVRRKRAYNFVIDRFGRVYRVVAESDAANHAGYSVWADERWRYLNLNESFLGVALETRTDGSERKAEINPAQVRAAAMLLEMLRARYQIAASNCVTHAQVSVNPSNMEIGYHNDWASGFPFEQVGLPNNYREPLPSIWAFGFHWDSQLRLSGEKQIASAIDAGAQALREQAAQAGLTSALYQKALQTRYRLYLDEMRHLQSQ